MNDQNSPESENASVQTDDYVFVKQDGFITVHPDLHKLFSKYQTPKPMEVEEGSITFEKNG